MSRFCARGDRCNVVYPLIEESEKTDLRAATAMAEQLQREVLPEFRVGLLHGRLKSNHKEHIMRAFSTGDLEVLVSTTVIGSGWMSLTPPSCSWNTPNVLGWPVTPAPGARGAQPSPSVLSVDGRISPCLKRPSSGYRL